MDFHELLMFLSDWYYQAYEVHSCHEFYYNGYKEIKDEGTFRNPKSLIQKILKIYSCELGKTVMRKIYPSKIIAINHNLVNNIIKSTQVT